MVRLIPISHLKGFTPQEFCVSPRWWGYTSVCYYENEYSDILNEARKKAREVDEICFVMVEDKFGTYVLAEPCNKGRCTKFLLLNAAETNRMEGQVFAITFNTGRGALTTYLLEKYIKYQPGSEF